MEFTVITRQRVFGHKPGSVIVVEDSPMVRGLLARNRLDLVDPPELPPLEEVDNGRPNSSDAETGSDQELPEQPKRTRNAGSRKASAERPAEGEGTSSGSGGDSGRESADRENYTEGEAYRTSDE